MRWSWITVGALCLVLGSAGCSFAPDLDGARFQDGDVAGVDSATPDAMEVLEDDAGVDLNPGADIETADVEAPEDLPGVNFDAEPDSAEGDGAEGDSSELPASNLPENLCGQAVGDASLQALCEESDCQGQAPASFCGQEDCEGEACTCAEGEACSEACSNRTSCGVACEPGALCGLESTHMQTAWLECGQDASCHHSCRQMGNCRTTCLPGSSCEAVCKDNSSCDMTCESGSRCAMLCTGSGDCHLQCKNGAHCTLILVNDEGQLDCNGPDRTQHCDRPGVSTCRQACPE